MTVTAEEIASSSPSRRDVEVNDIPSRDGTGVTPSDVPLLGPMTQRRVLGMATPIIGENLLQTAVGAVDTLMVAKLGKEAVAGVGTAAELVFFIISILMALEVGATVLISQAFGARELESVKRLARQSLVWGVVVAIPVSIGGYLAAGPVIRLFGTEPAVAQHATTYLQITAATSLALLLTFVCGAIFRGVGDSRTPLYASVLANAVHVVVAYVLIFGHLGFPELGVAGSAWSAAIARTTSATVMLAILVRGRRAVSIRGRAGWFPRLQTARSLFRLGLPASFEQALTSLGFTTMLAVVALLGTAALAAQQIAFTALSIAFMPGFGFAMAATALVGQSVGARRLDEAGKAARIAELWAVAWMAIGGVVYFVLAPPVMEVFTDDRAVLNAGANALRAISLSLPFWAIWSVNGGALRGLGDTRTPLVMSVITVWSAVGLAYLLVTSFDGGLGMVWFTFMFTSPVGAFGNWYVLRRRLRATRELLAGSGLPATPASVTP
ncbi:MAG TPA: MATE family efflux transporter [Thermomicrobiales bacterium]|nr:MATE family efflux transporter [Thermomicrobiales bacterium]